MLYESYDKCEDGKANNACFAFPRQKPGHHLSD